MNLCLINHSYRYELEKLVRIFLPFEKIEFFDCFMPSNACAVSQIDGNIAKAELYLNGKAAKNECEIDMFSDELKREEELRLALCLFDCFCSVTGYIPDWGILTGIRPAKLFSRFTAKMGNKAAEEYFSKNFKVADKKLSLCKQAYEGECNIVRLSSEKSYSLYISIPFCPTRCSYCSFVSHSVDTAKKLIPKYVEMLTKELIITADIAKKCDLKLETVYIGGGTPTAIEAAELEKIMRTVENNFDLSYLREYTVEAGRPDTVTKEKLEVIKKYKATRISINPQAMNDSVLKVIGRNHTSKQTVEAFKLAREMGFDNINMDLIAGLPTDTLDSFKNTIDAVLELDPESITVHSLSFKRSSFINMKGELPEISAGKTASQMVDMARQELSKNGIMPYYMYRQSKTVGNLENVGYAKKGFECLYNVFIMDETHTILANGASAVTKLREPDGDYIERIFNFKYPYEYIDRFEELISRKDGIIEFYDKYGNRN